MNSNEMNDNNVNMALGNDMGGQRVHSDMPSRNATPTVADFNFFMQEMNLIRNQNEELARRFQVLSQNQNDFNGTSPPNPSVPNDNTAGKVKHDKPSKFHGNKPTGIMVDNWIYAVRNFVIATGLKGERAVALAVSFTEDVALQFSRNRLQFMQTSREHGRPEIDYLPLIDLDAYMGLIRENFYPVDATQKNRDALDRLRQVRSVTEYVSEFRSLLMQIPAEDWTEADMKDKFLRNLKPRHREFTLMKDDDGTTLNETFQNALRADSILFGNTTGNNTSVNFSRRFQPRRSTVSFKDPQAMDVDFVHVKPNGRPYRGQSEAKKPGVCWDCDMPGHRRGDPRCSKANAKQSGNGRQQQ